MSFDAILHATPGIPDSANDDFDIGPDGVLSAADRRILRFLLKSYLPEVPPDAYIGIRCVGDLREFVAAHGQDRSYEPLISGAAATASIFMRPVMPSDIEQLYVASLEPGNSFRWRFRGHTVSLREFSDSLSVAVMAQYCFCSRETGALLAFASAYSHDAISRHCTFAIQRLDFGPDHSTVITESCLLFLDYLFRTFNLNKVFADLPEYNYPLFGLLTGVFHKEATKSEYYWHAGRYWDETTISVSNESWTNFAVRLFSNETHGN